MAFLVPRINLSPEKRKGSRIDANIARCIFACEGLHINFGYHVSLQKRPSPPGHIRGLPPEDSVGNGAVRSGGARGRRRASPGPPVKTTRRTRTTATRSHHRSARTQKRTRKSPRKNTRRKNIINPISTTRTPKITKRRNTKKKRRQKNELVIA